MKKLLIAMILVTVPLPSLAGREMGAAEKNKQAAQKNKQAAEKNKQASEKNSQSDNPADAYFSQQNPKLTPQEMTGIAISQKWRDGTATGIKPVAGPAGSVRFNFGSQQVNIVCAVLQVCDVELQSGEQVNNLNLGDPRFTVEPALSGAGATEVQHLIIKPLDVGLMTTLIVTTNRRTYHLNLRSHRTEFMPRISFIYPEDVGANWDAIRNREAKDRREQTLPQTKEYLGDLNFKYSLSGSARWKPVRVYNDGVKTIIQMPSAMAQTEAPTLLVVRKEGGMFSDDETVMVNYRVHADRYIVDTVFDKAVLVAGVGRGQDRVTITRGK